MLLRRSTLPAHRAVWSIFSSVLVAAALTHAAETNIVTRVFEVLPGVEERIGVISSEPDTGTHEEDFIAIGNTDLTSERDDWTAFFSVLGIKWPEGSSVRYSPSSGLLVVANTPENLAVMAHVLTPDLAYHLIDIEAHFVAFDPADIETIAMTAPTGIVDKASLFELRQQGKAELLFAPKVVTPSGAEATMKAVTEFIYPTEFQSEPIIGSGEATTRTHPVNEHQQFETREAGIIFTVLPEVSCMGQFLEVALAPETVRRKHDAKGASNRDPIFHTLSASTTVKIANGETVVVFGGTWDIKGTKMVYVLLTARLINPDGTPVQFEALEFE